MRTENLIATKQFCIYHEVEDTFITELQQAGLIEVTVVNQDCYIPESELQKLERLTRLHNELEINTAGIEAISHLLQRLEDIQEEMRQLRNKLNAYE
jgi:chaperone modulatory protein CbpM